MKVYNQFSDRHGNEYRFGNYIEFARFWFNLPRAYAKANFPNFAKLQSAAANSKEARQSVHNQQLTKWNSCKH